MAKHPSNQALYFYYIHFWCADECLSDLARVKRKTKLDIPHHVVGGRNEPNGQAVDDLVHILQDNYHSDQMRTGASGIAEAEFVNMDQYVKSIATIVYEEYYEPCIRCVVGVTFTTRCATAGISIEFYRRFSYAPKSFKINTT